MNDPLARFRSLNKLPRDLQVGFVCSSEDFISKTEVFRTIENNLEMEARDATDFESRQLLNNVFRLP